MPPSRPGAESDAAAPVGDEDAGRGGDDAAVVADGSLPDRAPPVDLATDPPPPSVELARALALYLPLDDGMGSRLGDASGRNQMVRLRVADPATSWAPGRFGSAVELSGGMGGGYLLVDSSFTLVVPRTELSLSAWILLPADGGDGVIASQRATGTGGYLYSLRIVRGRLNCLINSASGYHADLTSPGPLPREAWVHVAMTFDSHQVRLWVNGKAAGAADYLLSIPPDPSAILFGGAETENGNAQPADVVGRLAARLDELALFDRVLSPAEVAQLALGVRPRVILAPPR
jgi:hypothetical protein